MNRKSYWYYPFSLFVLLVLVQLAVVQPIAYAQTSPLSIQNLSSVKIDEVSDEQIAKFWQKAKSSGLTMTQLEEEAIKRNMPAEELSKLKARISKIDNAAAATVTAAPSSEPRVYEGEVSEKANTKVELAFDQVKTKIFGAELFNNKSITFEPNLKIPTPQNYLLGPDDEVAIDIFGYSEASYQLRVSPEGNIRIPTVGPIQVSGLTIEQARKKITNQLSKIYGGIGTGETNVSITLSNIRSIKVILLGEITIPGTYTLPSLATVFNALYASGGPNQNGSFRNIKVIRNNKVVATVDVYDFLMNGSAKDNIRLQDQDVIKVNPYETRIEIKGAVKREGIYEAAKNETLKDILDYAGGFTDHAYKERIKVIRNTEKQRSVADVPAELYAMFPLRSGDIYEVGQVLDRFENRVQIQGAVFRAGNYALEPDLTLKKLVEKAEGLKEDAFVNRGLIFRLKDDNSLEVVSFDIGNVMSGKDSDIPLKREDSVIIASKFDLKETYDITIYGEVLKPGVYPYADNMTIQDFLVAAGGLKASASPQKIQVARRIYTSDRMSSEAKLATILTVDVNRELSSPEANKFKIEPYDVVTVFPLPGFVKQITVSITGQVMYPGEYVISENNERVSDIINRAGGLTVDAFVDGSTLLRQRLKGRNQDVVLENKLRSLEKLSKDDEKTAELNSEELSKEQDLVGINLEKILKRPGGDWDPILRSKDVINIPTRQQTVLVSGEVLFPVKVIYNKNLSFKDYINRAGGYTIDALNRKSYVVYSNGTSKATKKFLFIKIRPKIKPGAEIIVPPKKQKEQLTTPQTLAVLTSTTTLLVLVLTLFKK